MLRLGFSGTQETPATGTTTVLTRAVHDWPEGVLWFIVTLTGNPQLQHVSRLTSKAGGELQHYLTSAQLRAYIQKRSPASRSYATTEQSFIIPCTRLDLPRSAMESVQMNRKLEVIEILWGSYTNATDTLKLSWVYSDRPQDAKLNLQLIAEPISINAGANSRAKKRIELEGNIGGIGSVIANVNSIEFHQDALGDIWAPSLPIAALLAADDAENVDTLQDPEFIDVEPDVPIIGAGKTYLKYTTGASYAGTEECFFEILKPAA